MSTGESQTRFEYVEYLPPRLYAYVGVSRVELAHYCPWTRDYLLACYTVDDHQWTSLGAFGIDVPELVLWIRDRPEVYEKEKLINRLLEEL